MSIEILWEQWYCCRWDAETTTMEHIPVYPTPEQREALLKPVSLEELLKKCQN